MLESYGSFVVVVSLVAFCLWMSFSSLLCCPLMLFVGAD